MARVLPVLLGMVLLLPLSPALVGQDGDVGTVTYYLHSGPSGHAVDQVAEGFVAGQPGPWMDAEAPTSDAPKLARGTGLGNPDFRKNFLLAYWGGNVTGRVKDLHADLWMSAEVGTNVTASLFGDGGIGVSGSFARETVFLPAGTPRLVRIDFGDAAANVASEMVLSLGAELDSAGVVILHDAASFASSLTFTLTDIVVVPPHVATPAVGWANVSVINATAAHRETSLAISPTDPDLMIACAPSGLLNLEKGQSFFHVSRDGGTTWGWLQVETADTDPRRFAFEGGDCDVAFDAAGNMYSADTWLGSLSIGRSDDGGLTWTGTSLASSAPVVDRPWIVGGPENVLHVTWQDVQALMPSAIWYARSTDGGLTFTPAVSVATANQMGAFTWTGNLAVSPDQESLYSVYTRRVGPNVGSLDDAGPETVWVARSIDGGLTWTQHLVAAMPNPASFLYPSIGLDAGGILHVVFSSRTSEDRPIWYVRSVDGADTWSAPLKVQAGVAGWSPWVVGGTPGEAAIQWYGTLDPQGNTSAPFDWYFFAARAKDGVITSTGPTTTTPIFSGIQSAIPEFNQVRLDAEGRMNLGASAFHEADGALGWALFFQREG